MFRKNMDLHKIAVRVASIRKADFDFQDLKSKVELYKENVENTHFKDQTSEEELEDVLDEISNLIITSRPEAFLLFEDFLEMLDEFDYADKRDKSL